MTKHYNPSIVERLNRTFRPKAGDQFTDQVSGPVAVIPVEPVCRIIRSGNLTGTGSLSVYTTPTDKDFYLTGVVFTMAKDATCDTPTGSVGLNVTVDGVATAVVSVAFITLTAFNQTVSYTFSTPVKVDRGTTIGGSATVTAGTMRRTACIHGYTEETIAT